MVILHESGSIVDTSAIEQILPVSRNKQNGVLQLIIIFNSGKEGKFSDMWLRDSMPFVSIYEIILTNKIKEAVDYRDLLKEVRIQ